MDTKIIQNAAKTAIDSAIKQSPKILTIVGIGGFLTTVIFAVKAKPKADLLLDEALEIKKAETGDNSVRLNAWETVKAVTPAFWPTALMFVLSTTAVVASDVICYKRQTALALAYTLADQGLKEYQQKLTETVGQKKRDEIDQAIEQDKVNSNPPPTNSPYYMNHRPTDTEFKDPYNGRYFWANIADVDMVVNRINERKNRGEDIMLNDLYYELDKISSCGDIGETVLGASYGWRCSDGLIERRVLATTNPITQNPCLVLRFEPEPAMLDY